MDNIKTAKSFDPNKSPYVMPALAVMVLELLVVLVVLVVFASVSIAIFSPLLSLFTVTDTT